ncbi:MAG: AIPR family protein [Bryobacteraceae bacterium]
MKLGSAGERSSYVGRVGAAQLAELFTRERSRLFTLNIRNYIGDTATNKTIRKTALEDAENFFFFNNGISALAESVEEDKKDARILHCRNLSIVNGAQTVRSLHKAHVEDPVRVRGVQVLFRLTETTSKKTSTEQEFLDNLTKYNNTQNAIKVSDFRSNDKIQHDIKERFYALPSVKGKKFSYKRKRSGPGERDVAARTDTTIGMEEFTKTLFAFLFGPDDVYGGTSYVFDATGEGGYTKLFGDNGQILPSLSKETFEYYSGIWFVCNFAKELWRTESRKTKHSSLERRWMFFYALGEALRTCYGDKGTLRMDLRRLSSPAWIADGPDGKVQKVIERLSRLTFKALKEAYNSASSSGGGNFTHRNWFRSQTSLQIISDKVADSWTLLSEYADDYRLPHAR